MTNYFLPKVGDKIMRLKPSTYNFTSGEIYPVISVIENEDTYCGYIMDNAGRIYFIFFFFIKNFWKIVDHNFIPDKEYEDLYV